MATAMAVRDPSGDYGLGVCEPCCSV
jgi:hypothetical protein